MDDNNDHIELVKALCIMKHWCHKSDSGIYILLMIFSSMQYKC